jgi:hypothetical protein
MPKKEIKIEAGDLVCLTKGNYGIITGVIDGGWLYEDEYIVMNIKTGMSQQFLRQDVKRWKKKADKVLDLIDARVV